MTDITGVPSAQAMVDGSGRITQAWRQFLVALWLRTGGGGGGGVFNQNTDYVLSPSQVTRSTAARFLDFVTFTDYGAIGDGVFDCTAALNAFIADVNSGLVQKMYVPPGQYLIKGNTTVITAGKYAIFGAGNGISEIRISGGASILLDMVTVATGRSVCCTWADIKFSGADAAPYVRQLARFSMSSSILPEQVQLQMTNVQVDPGFKYGIETVNALFGSFVNVSINSGGHNAGMQWAWKCWATPTNYTLGLQWWNCGVSALGTGWLGVGHFEGFVWTDCLREFVNYGIDYVATDATYVPYMHVHGGQGEAYIRDIRFGNCAYVEVDTQSYCDAGAIAVALDGCFGINVHDCQIVTSGAGNLINITNCVSGQIDDNSFNGLNGGIGIYLDGTTTNVNSNNNRAINPAAGSLTYYNGNFGAGATTNQRRGEVIMGAFADNGLVVGSSAGGTVTVAVQTFAQAQLPCYAGDRIQLQCTFQITTPSVQPMEISCRIREYIHRPGGGSPFNVIRTYAAQNYLEDTRSLPSTGFGTIIINLDADVDVVGTAPDALFVAEAFTDNGTALVQLISLRAKRL